MDRRANWLTMKVATAIAILLCAGVKSHAQDTSAAAVKAANVAPTSEFPDALPAATFMQMTSGRKLVGMPGLTWNRQVLTVAFEGGSDPLYVLIEQTASEWTATGGALRFSFREREPNGPFRRWSSQDTEPAAAIRVSFRSDADYKGYWSVIGIMAENIDANKPTMNFDGFPEKLASYYNGQKRSIWLASYEHTVVLHEFGHALGLAHEHFHPDCQADLQLDMAIASLMNPPNNWGYDLARFNTDASYYFIVTANATSLNTNAIFSGKPDQSSVMLYRFSDDFYKSGARSPCKPAGSLGYATKLSKGDAQFFLDKYGQITPPF